MNPPSPYPGVTVSIGEGTQLIHKESGLEMTVVSENGDYWVCIGSLGFAAPFAIKKGNPDWVVGYHKKST